MNEEFDWRTREDADVLKRYSRLKRDEERMAKAHKMLMEEKQALMSALNDAKPKSKIETLKDNHFKTKF